ncbi:hypothetical protein ACFYUH_20045 [Streptomyces fimicarius]
MTSKQQAGSVIGGWAEDNTGRRIGVVIPAFLPRLPQVAPR